MFGLKRVISKTLVCRNNLTVMVLVDRLLKSSLCFLPRLAIHFSKHQMWREKFKETSLIVGS